MGRVQYAKFFFTGRKSKSMKSIEKRFPDLGKFKRGEAFFHAFGNLDLWNVPGIFLILLPARHEFDLINCETCFIWNCGLFSLYYTKKKQREIIYNDG